MVGILEKLTSHISKRQAAKLTGWADFVLAVESEKLTDLEEISEKLESLGMTPADLQKAIDRLKERRDWSQKAAAVPKAERELDKARAAIEAEEERFAKLQESHERTMEKLMVDRNRATQQVSDGVDARRRLIETASQSAKSAAFARLDEELSEVQQELGRLNQAFRDKERWIQEVESLGSAASSSDIDRLAPQRVALQGLRLEVDTLQTKLAALQERRNAADAELWKPEAGL